MATSRMGIVLGLSFILWHFPARSDDADDALKEANQLLEEFKRFQAASNYDEVATAFSRAIRRFDEVVRLRPEANSYLWRGRAHAADSGYSEAIGDFNRAIALDPLRADAFHDRGVSYTALHRYDEAIRDFGEAIRLEPGSADHYMARAVVYDERHQSREYLAELDTVIRLRPTDAEAHTRRGCQLANLGEDEKALASLDEAVRLRPDDAFARQSRGYLLVKVGLRPDQAAEDIGKVIEHDADPYHFLILGQLRMNLGQFDRAVADFSQAIRLQFRPNPLARLSLGDAEADRNFAEFARPEPAPYMARGVAYSKLGQYERALRDFDEAIHLGPDAGLYSVRAVVLGKLGRIDAAIRDCDKALGLDPRKADFHELRAALALEVGDCDRAVGDYDEALRLDSSRAASLYYRGLLALALDRTTVAGQIRGFLDREGWGGEKAACIALVGFLLEKKAGRPAEAHTLLDEAVRRCDKTWPAPILRHLRGDITEAELLKAADDPDRLQAVPFFLGLDRLVSGDRAGALDRLRRACDGADDSTFTTLARAALVRLEALAPVAR